MALKLLILNLLKVKLSQHLNLLDEKGRNSMSQLVVGLIILSILLIVLEFVVPGAILGFLGLAGFIVAILVVASLHQ